MVAHGETSHPQAAMANISNAGSGRGSRMGYPNDSASASSSLWSLLSSPSVRMPSRANVWDSPRSAWRSRSIAARASTDSGRYGSSRRTAVFAHIADGCSFQGLSEREASELVARSLLFTWGVRPDGPVKVVRAAGAPYAAAYLDGVLRLNPAFVYMASAPSTP